MHRHAPRAHWEAAVGDGDSGTSPTSSLSFRNSQFVGVVGCVCEGNRNLKSKLILTWQVFKELSWQRDFPFRGT